MATATRTRSDWGGVDLKLLGATVLLIAVEVWYLATQARSVVIPLMWMAPVDVFLLVYAVDETLALSEVAIVLFIARFIYLPFLLFAPMSNFLVFYALFMAPVDLFIGYYMIRAAGRRALGRAAPA